jgi:4-hydroxybenzoate polyprenyltransferase
MKTLKWIIAALVPAFVAGGSILSANGQQFSGMFWFGFLGAFVGGLAGMGVNKGIDKTTADD